MQQTNSQWKGVGIVSAVEKAPANTKMAGKIFLLEFSATMDKPLGCNVLEYALGATWVLGCSHDGTEGQRISLPRY